MNGGGDKKYFFDTVNIKVPRKGMEMVSCLRDGMGEKMRIYFDGLLTIYPYSLFY